MTNWHFLEKLRSLVKDRNLVVAFEMDREGRMVCTVTYEAEQDGCVVGEGRDLPEAMEDAVSKIPSADRREAASA